MPAAAHTFEDSGLPWFRPPCTISAPTYHRDMFRGEENPATGTVSWHVVGTHVYRCDANSDDDRWFASMQKHNENVRIANMRVSNMQQHYDDVRNANKRVRLSENLLTAPAGASREEGEEEDIWWDMTEQQRLDVANVPQGTAHEGSPPSRWRLDADGKFASGHSPDYWLTRGSSQPAVALVGSVAWNTKHAEGAASATAPAERRPRKRWAPMAAPAVIGLACAASSTTPAHGFSAAAYEASTFSFSTVREDSTCYSYVQPTAPAGVATEWGVLWVAVFVTIMVVAAFAAYTAWLFRYVGFRVSPKTNDVGMQTEWQSPFKKRIVRTPVEHHEAAVAPQKRLDVTAWALLPRPWLPPHAAAA